MGLRSVISGLSALGELRSGRTSPPSSLSAPADWLVKLLGLERTTGSGVSINEFSALNLSAVWACVRAISEDIAKLPLVLYTRDGKTRERAVSNPLYQLLHDAPNPEMSALVFRETLTAHALVWGNGYAWIERNNAGRPIALWPLKPNRVQIKRIESGDIVYIVTYDKGGTDTLYADDVLHIRGLGFEGLAGYSVIRQARESLGAATAMENYAGEFFANSAMPRMVLMHPGKLKDGGKGLRESWKGLFGQKGTDRQGTAVLEEGVQLKEMSMPNVDSQFLESRQFTVPTICRWFRVPPHKVYDLTRSTFSNIEQMSIDYIVDSLLGWMIRWEQEVSRKLIPEARRGAMYAEHLVAGLLRGELKVRFEAYAIARQNGWLSANDVRELENQNPVEGGDVYWAPVNMVPAQMLGQTPKVEKQRSRMATARQIATSHRRLFTETYRRVLRVEADKVRRNCRPSVQVEWAQTFYGEHSGYVRAALAPLVETIVDLVGHMGDPVRAAEPAVSDLVTRHVAASMRDLKLEGLDARLTSWESERPELEAARAVEIVGESLALSIAESQHASS